MFVFCIASLFLGVFSLMTGISTKWRDVTIAGIMMMLGGTILFMNHKSSVSIFIGFTLAILGVIFIISRIIRLVKAEKRNTARIQKDRQLEFYRECTQEGVRECRNSRDQEKASLIARKMNLSFTDITVLFNEAKALANKDAEEKAAAALDEIKYEERTERDQLVKYEAYSGRDKRIAILSDMLQSALNNANALQSGAAALLNASQEKEHDWATAGGIATGIGGLGAGIATALDVQAKNAQIREQNQKNLEYFNPVMMTSLEGVANNRMRARALEEQIEQTKTKLVSSDNAMTCLEHLEFSDVKYTVSDTGTITITTNVKLKTPMIIFDSVSAVIDGTVIANIIDSADSSIIGKASMVLPLYGVGEPAKLTGMCLYKGKTNGQYRITFTASNLWAMEQ